MEGQEGGRTTQTRVLMTSNEQSHIDKLNSKDALERLWYRAVGGRAVGGRAGDTLKEGGKLFSHLL